MATANPGMNLYNGHRLPPDVISYAVWLYHRFNFSHRDIEDLVMERGVSVSAKSIRLWCIKFRPECTGRLRRKPKGFDDVFYIDEVFVRIRDEQPYLWRADDGDGDAVDVLLRSRRDGRTATQVVQAADSESLRRAWENRDRQTGKLPGCPSGTDSRFV